MSRLVALIVILFSINAQAYPTDQWERTQIRRLKWQNDVNLGQLKGRRYGAGAEWPSDTVFLRLTETGSDFRLTAETPKDPELQAALEQILKKNAFKDYNVAILDITDPAHMRYAGVHEQDMQTPGSVAKLLVAAGLLNQLKARFPDDVTKREGLLRDIKMTADDWAMPNHHEVPVVNGTSVSIRKVLRGDIFTLWEWLDHAISPSSNAAATMVWRETLLMKLLGAAYPPAKYDDALYAQWDKATFTKAAFDVVDQPLLDAGLTPETFHLRLFFTKDPGKYLKGEESRTSPLALVQWMLTVEQGRMVDKWSSLELKRLMYLTRRRVRYAKAPELKEAGIFFKSGSLWECDPEPGFTCVEYQGNRVNVLNTLVEVDGPAPVATDAAVPPKPTPVYIVAVMSNELRKNAAEDHAKLASSLHELLQRR